jgi:hypothetical protein
MKNSSEKHSLTPFNEAAQDTIFCECSYVSPLLIIFLNNVDLIALAVKTISIEDLIGKTEEEMQSLIASNSVIYNKPSIARLPLRQSLLILGAGISWDSLDLLDIDILFAKIKKYAIDNGKKASYISMQTGCGSKFVKDNIISPINKNIDEPSKVMKTAFDRVKLLRDSTSDETRKSIEDFFAFRHEYSGILLSKKFKKGNDSNNDYRTDKNKDGGYKDIAAARQAVEEQKKVKKKEDIES